MAKDKTIEKTSQKRTLITMAIICIVGIITGVIIGTCLISGKIDPNRYNFDATLLKDDVVAIRKESDGKTPDQLGATKSCVLAFDTTFSYKKLSITGVGVVKAMGVNQTINAKTIRINDKIYYENISVSSFVKAINRYFIDGNKMDHYSGKLNGKTITWDIKPDYVKTMEAYAEEFGCPFTDYMTYIVSSKTVTEESAVIINSDGNYEFTLTLDKSKAVVNYVKTMKATGGLSQYPDFTSNPVIELTIDSQYRVIKFVSKETYNVKMGLTAKSEATLTNTFTYDEDYVMPKISDKSTI